MNQPNDQLRHRLDSGQGRTLLPSIVIRTIGVVIEESDRVRKDTWLNPNK
jgi:hypothetical protein